MKYTISTSLVYILLFSATCLSTNTAFAATGDQQFKQGIREFKSGHYLRAIVSFEQAKHLGKHSSALTYNLGVCYFKTAQYNKSSQAFTNLLADTKFRQLAQYNLGLVSLAQGHKHNAIKWFRRAADDQSNYKVTELSRQMLNKYAPKQVNKSISGLLSFGLGHNSNVTLASTGSPTHQADNYSQLFGFISVPTRSPLTINASLFSQNYRRVNSADFLQLSVGALYPFNRGHWRFTPAVYLAKDELGNSSFLSSADMRFKARTMLKDHSILRFRYLYRNYQADNSIYNYLQGNQQQFRVQRDSHTAVGQLRLRYDLELNNRENLPSANYSPTRHTFLVQLRQYLHNNWKTTEILSWRYSRYGSAAGINRNDKRYLLRLTAETYLQKRLSAGVTYAYTDNNSNVASESYTRNDLLAYINWMF